MKIDFQIRGYHSVVIDICQLSVKLFLSLQVDTYSGAQITPDLGGWPVSFI